MKTNIGQKGNKDLKVRRVKINQMQSCIKNNITANTGEIVYIANLDGTQGLMSKVVEGRAFFLVNNRWEEL